MTQKNFAPLRFLRPIASSLALALLLSCGAEPADSKLQDQELPEASAVDPYRELVLVHASIVEDQAYVSNQDQANGRPGRWSFRYLMEEMAPRGTDPADFVLTWLQDYKATQLNGFPLTRRPKIDAFIQNWPKRSDGKLDLRRAPFKLRAIVNRIDVSKNENDLGEGRFVFAALDPSGKPLPFTVIFEYNLPILFKNFGPAENRRLWAARFHAMAWDQVEVNGRWEQVQRPYGARFNAELAATTDLFAKRGANPEGVNGSSLSQLRSNEIALGEPWSLREFRLQANGSLRMAPTAQTPHATFNNRHPNPNDGSAFASRAGELLNFLSSNVDRVKNLEHTIPPSMLAAESLENFANTEWLKDPQSGAPLPITGERSTDEQVRKGFALSTCNGCHNAEVEQIAGFYHISPFDEPTRTREGLERLSPFLRNEDIPRRAAFVQHLLCGGECAVPAEAISNPVQAKKFKKAQRPLKRRPH